VIKPERLRKHNAVDIGVERAGERMALGHGIPAHLARISRLVCDLHREYDAPTDVHISSIRYMTPCNVDCDIEERLARFHRPYHAALGDWLDAAQPELIVALHSFTPRLESGGEERPWEVALLYNEDDRAARHAIRLFAEEGLTVGDNQPYS